VFGDVELVALHELGEVLGSLISDALEARDATDDIEGQLKAIHAIEDDHVERCGGGALLDVAADMEIVVVAAAVGQR
jgi:hypothetical protein